MKSWNFKKISIPADGDCLFTAIALAITNRVEQGDNLLMKRLATLGITHPNVQKVQFIQQLLRTEMVQQWIDSPIYQGFVTTDITAVAHTYLQSGTFSGELGDLMVLTLANILQMPITIFTSIEQMPILCVMPKISIVTTTPIFLLCRSY